MKFKTNPQQFLMQLQIMKMQLMALNVHTVSEEENIFQHNEKKCPMCRADYYLNGGI